MGKVNVVIVDATGNKEQKVGLPDDIKCGIIMVKLIEKIKLPSVGPDGNPISYKFIHKVTGKQLLESQTLGEAGIKDGDVLRLQPEITAGATCPNCGAQLMDGTMFCTNCGAAMQNSVPTYSQPQPTYGQQQQAAQTKPFEYTPMPTPTKTLDIKESLFDIIGTAAGALSILFGLIISGYSTGGYENTATYGGDAYTGMQNASAQAANNVQDLAAIAKFGFMALLIVLGLALVCYFAPKVLGKIKK